MQLPNELVTVLSVIIGGFVVKLVTDGIKGLSESLGYDLGKIGSLIAAALSTCIVTVAIGLINFGLGFVPPQYAPIVQGVFAVLLTLLSGMGLHRQAKLARPVQF
jgi:hypothetical protein